jgi:hypothetical protein
MGPIKYPSLYQINTRVLLTQLSKKLGRPANLDDIPDSKLDAIAKKGFDWAWFLSVWPDYSDNDNVTPGLRFFYQGQRQLLESNPAWQGNGTSQCHVSFAWQGADRAKLLVVVNFAPPWTA